jgi:hypothetical protein
MTRKVEILVYCEDSQQEAFIRRFLKMKNYPRNKIDVHKSPRGKGSAEQWVLNQFVNALNNYRKRKVDHKIVFIRDADTLTLNDRIRQFESACRLAGIQPRQPNEKIALILPRRNIETWFEYLNGATVDETTVYRKYDRAGDCFINVRALVDMCDRQNLRQSAPPSLENACDEFKNRLG